MLHTPKLIFALLVASCLQLIIPTASFAENTNTQNSNAQHRTIIAQENQSEIGSQNPVAQKSFQAGLDFYKAKNLSEAESAFRKAVEADPKFAEAYANLGSVLANQNKVAQAIPQFEKAVSLRPDIPFLHYQLGIALYLEKRPTDAITSLEKAKDLLTKSGNSKDAAQIESAIKKIQAEQ